MSFVEDSDAEDLEHIKYVDEAQELLQELRRHFCDGKADQGARSRALDVACLESMAICWINADASSKRRLEDRALMVSGFMIRDVIDAVRTAFEISRDAPIYQELSTKRQ